MRTALAAQFMAAYDDEITARPKGQPNGLGSKWRDAKLCARLFELNDGRSASRIASALTVEFGVLISRNAVLGALFRAGAKSRCTRQRGGTMSVPQAARRPRIVKPKPSLVVPDEPVSLAIPLVDARDGQCRFIAGDPTYDATVCGHPVQTGSYCSAHWKKTHDPVSTSHSRAKAEAQAA